MVARRQGGDGCRAVWASAIYPMAACLKPRWHHQSRVTEAAVRAIAQSGRAWPVFEPQRACRAKPRELMETESDRHGIDWQTGLAPPSCWPSSMPPTASLVSPTACSASPATCSTPGGSRCAALPGTDARGARNCDLPNDADGAVMDRQPRQASGGIKLPPWPSQGDRSAGTALAGCWRQPTYLAGHLHLRGGGCPVSSLTTAR